MGGKLYEKSVKELFRDLMDQSSSPLSRQEIIDWFSVHYPLVKETTVNAHIYWLTTNNPNRTSPRAVDPSGDDDIIYRTADDLFRKYIAGKDEPAYH